ncbi:hypothetical protein SB778_44010, partial [Paraburkholderia sp. SIMBA_050]
DTVDQRTQLVGENRLEILMFRLAGVSNKGAVFGPMADVVHNSLQYMNDEDTRAMSTYLKSIPQKAEAPKNMQYEPSKQFGNTL